MRRLALLLAAVLGAACAHGGAPGAGTTDRAAVDEAGLAEALAGRTAGPEQRCAERRELGAPRSYGRGAIVFGSGNDPVLWVSRPPAGCPEVDAYRRLEWRSGSAQLCAGDPVTVLDRQTGVQVGGCALGPFTPWRR